MLKKKFKDEKYRVEQAYDDADVEIQITKK